MKKYSDTDIQVFKAKLEKLKASQEAVVQSLEIQLTELSEKGKGEDIVDVSNIATEKESILVSKNRLLKHLNFINNALLRIKNKTYGVCAETGKLISKERLNAVPTTTLSMEGKKIRERNQT